MGDRKAIAVVDGNESDFNISNQTKNPNVVESVTFLKDGSTYGVRGMNGVIVITSRTE